jgi:hypothetical protein
MVVVVEFVEVIVEFLVKMHREIQGAGGDIYEKTYCAYLFLM